MSVEQRMAQLERELRGLKTTQSNLRNKQSKNVYYTVPVYTMMPDGRETVTNILYTHDKFEPGEMQCRVHSPSGESKVVSQSEYIQIKDNKNWFDSAWQAKEFAKASEVAVEKKVKKVSKAEIVDMLKGESAEA